MNVADILPWTELLASLADQVMMVSQALKKEGGATKDDLIALQNRHEQVRQRVQEMIDAMPDAPQE